MPKNILNPLVFLSYLDEWSEEVQLQLESDAERHGSEYLECPRSGQTERIMRRFNDYLQDWLKFGEPVPWLKVAGLAFIAWLREKHPQLSPHWKHEERFHGFFTEIHVPEDPKGG